MKSLVDYIKEAKEETIETSKNVTFDFTGFENSEETVKSLQDLGTEHGITVSADGQKVSISFTADTLDKAEPIINALQQAIDVIGKSSKRASDEQYAQKIQKLEKTMNSVHEFVDMANKDDDENNGQDE